MISKVPSSISFDGLIESGPDPELKTLIQEIRKSYQENKPKGRVFKVGCKRHFLLKSACIFSVFTGLITILYFS